MSSDINDLIAALRDGSMTLEEVAHQFRSRPWPRRLTTPSNSYVELAKETQRDSPSYAPGSFDDVAAAHQQGMLTDDEYAVLSEAVAEAKRAEDEGRGGV